MFKLVILLAFVAVAIGAADTRDEVMAEVEGRIVGGTPIIIASAPYTVSVQVSGKHRCGGVIISPNRILTSAGCVKGTRPSNLLVRAGSSYPNVLGVLMGVDVIRINERYNPNTRENDLAVLSLTGTLRLGTNIKTIPIATRTPANGSAATIAGWGRTIPNSPNHSEHLYSASGNIIGRAECAQTGYGSEIKNDNICFAAPLPGIGACTGDEGGPLVVNNILVGIISWGRGCAVHRYPTVAVNVALHRNWIINASHQV